MIQQDEFYYQKYLNSETWKHKRLLRLKIDGYKCRTCWDTKDLEVHHLTYIRFGNEDISDLITLCQDCHNAITSIAKEKRNENMGLVWGRWYCRDSKSILAFDSYEDAFLANEDGFSSFSTGSADNYKNFPDNWPNLWFPNSKNLIAVFQKTKETFAGQLCREWNKSKGSLMARVFHYPPLENQLNYYQYRKTYSSSDFLILIEKQNLEFKY